MSAHRGNGGLPLDSRDGEELCALLACLVDDEISRSERVRLNQILNQSADARFYYFRYIALHTALVTAVGSQMTCSTFDAQLAVERMTLDRFAGRLTEAPTCGLKATAAVRERQWRQVIRWVVSISAALLVAVAALWWNQHVGRVDYKSVSDAARPDIPNRISAPPDVAAEVTFVSASALWPDSNRSYARATPVNSGEVVALEHGQIELTYSSGAKLLLTGPFEFLVHPKGGSLRRGELVALVPKAGHGFTIETPQGKVVDLGTEFGVVVDDFGVSQVSVFEGKVEAMPTGAVAADREKFELTSGRAIQWTDQSVIPINLHGHRYRRPGNELPANEFARLTKTSIDEDFRGNAIARPRWQQFGQILPTDRGLQLGSDSANSQRPYLLTAQEFDPSQGAVIVVCDLRFESARDAEHASFAILTRSSAGRSKPGSPWHDMLARSVRCRLTADSRSGEGMLEAGAKYEADREHTNISWGGFSRPQPNTLYRVEMRDDGLNVSFKVSAAGNPSVEKTITCRSLFRANQNFVALEGPNTGSVIVERLMILQESPSMADTDTLAGPTVTPSVKRHAKQLDDLAPTDAELLLKDDFDDGRLNSTIWTTLGDVVLTDGQVQLGLPNDDQHIDTWRARPYLLTKEQFDPAEGELIILGKGTFAENFLHGYGGSFAVMTRADSARGGGPAWENSILRRGIRSNFWPAAYGFDHSLQIHEKPTPNSIVLLAAEGFRISPNSRSYFFRVVDDGQTATLTVIDVRNPDIRKTISHVTSRAPVSLASGHIGFESCWGSPVLLDNVRVFQRRLDSADVARRNE